MCPVQGPAEANDTLPAVGAQVAWINVYKTGSGGIFFAKNYPTHFCVKHIPRESELCQKYMMYCTGSSKR